MTTKLEFPEDDFLRFCWFSLPPADRARMLAKKAKTAWLFGAGASYHYNLNRFGVRVPLASGFFKAFNELPPSQGFGAHVGPLISFLEHYKGVPPQDVNQWDENIEDFMTSIEAKLDELRDKHKQKGRLREKDFADLLSYAMVFNNMNFIFANVLNEAQNGAPGSLYHMLLEICGPNDSFITFNWDTLLDRALADSGGWTPQDGYGVTFTSILDSGWRKKMQGKPQYDTKWRLLKLHGSTNWLVPYLAVKFDDIEYTSIVPGSDRVFLYWNSSLPFPTHKGRWRGGYTTTCYGYYPPNIPGNLFEPKEISAGPGKVFVRYTPRLFSAYAGSSERGVPASPLLVTPVRQKKYDMYASTVGSIWDQAAKNLAEASRIVIIGYSFPRTDTKAITLLKDSLSARPGEISVELVAPDATAIANRIDKAVVSLAKSFTPRDLTFEEYLEDIDTQIPSMMRTAASQDAEVRQWIQTMMGLSSTTEEQRAALHRGSGGTWNEP